MNTNTLVTVGQWSAAWISPRAILFLFLILSGLGMSQNKRPMTPEDLWKFKRVSSFEISPDKQNGAFVLTEYNIEENKGYSDIYLINLSNRQMKRLTTAKAGDGAPVWSPDSKRIAFISKREDDEKAQLYIISLDGGEAERFTDMPMGVSSVKWFPDGERICFASNTLPNVKNFDELKKEIKKRKDSKITAKVTENRFYRYWDNWLTDGFITHLYSLNTKDKKVTDLTPSLNMILSYSGSGASYDISPDAKLIALSANVTAAPYSKSLNFDVFLLNTESEEMVNITEGNISDDSSPQFTKDNKYLTYSFTKLTDVIAENSKIGRYNLSTKSMDVLTDKFDYSVNSWFYSEDNKSLYFNAEDKARIGIFRLNTDGEEIEKIFGEGTSGNISLANNKLYFIHQSFTKPPYLASFDISTRKLEKLSDFNDALLDSIEFGKTEEIYYQGAGTDTVQMYLIYPPGFDETKKYGLVHLFHGGPLGAFMDDFHFRWNGQMFAAMGYVVATVNFHGSSGFGERFAQSLKGAQAEYPFEDVMKATDYLLNKYSFLDAKRIAAGGGSYGGYLTNWIAGNTNRFAALISHAGVYNLMGQFASDLTHFREISYGGSPWNNTEKLMSQSPAQYAKNFNTPMLIIHGEKDYRVVITQGLEIYGVLQGKGIPSRLVYYPDENHWILSPQNSIFWFNEYKAWLDRWLK